MRLIISIIGKEKRTSKAGKEYWKTLALLDNGVEAWGYGDDFRVRDEVEVLYHSKFDEIKMRKTPKAIDK